MERQPGYQIPEDFAAFIARYFKDEGLAWLDRLPGILDWCAKTWRLRIEPPEFVLSYNYVVPATREDGTRAVLKVGVPETEYLTEVDALLFFDGAGVVRLLEYDYDQGAQLLERLDPGTMLLDLFPERDEQATAIAAEVMQRLWRPAPAAHRFPSVNGWAARGMHGLRAEFDGGTGPFPRRLVEHAEATFGELLDSAADQVVLHGDFHHYNVLSATRSPWLAIDPKGVIGEPAYEVGPFICNPHGLLDLDDHPRLLRRRIDQLASHLREERERIWGLALAYSVLSAWWDYDVAHDAWHAGIGIAEALAGVEP